MVVGIGKRFRGWMGAEKYSIEERISMTRIAYSLLRMNIRKHECEQPNQARRAISEIDRNAWHWKCLGKLIRRCTGKIPGYCTVSALKMPNRRIYNLFLFMQRSWCGTELRSCIGFF